MKAYKFWIPPRNETKLAPEDQPENGSLSVDGLLAIAVAGSQDEAMKLLIRRAKEDGYDARWLKVAKVAELSIEQPTRLCWVEI